MRAQPSGKSGHRTLRSLLIGTDVRETDAPMDLIVSGLASDSRQVRPGDLFFALPGRRRHGIHYLQAAAARGAVAAVVDRVTFAPAGLPIVRVDSVIHSIESVAKRFYEHPDRRLSLLGVMGGEDCANIAAMAHHLIERQSRPAGLICSDIHFAGRGRPEHPTHPAPDAIEWRRLFAAMREADSRVALVEVSTSAILKRQFDNLGFYVLLYHGHGETEVAPGTLEAASDRAIESFLLRRGGRQADRLIINQESASGRSLLRRIPTGFDTISYGTTREATIRFVQSFELDGQAFGQLEWPGGSTELVFPFEERGRILEAVGAIAIAYSLEMEMESISRLSHSLTDVRLRDDLEDPRQTFLFGR